MKGSRYYRISYKIILILSVTASRNEASTQPQSKDAKGMSFFVFLLLYPLQCVCVYITMCTELTGWQREGIDQYCVCFSIIEIKNLYINIFREDFHAGGGIIVCIETIQQQQQLCVCVCVLILNLNFYENRGGRCVEQTNGNKSPSNRTIEIARILFFFFDIFRPSSALHLHRF